MTEYWRLLKPFLPSVIIMVIIFCFSAQPAEESSEISAFLGTQLFTAANHLFGFNWSIQQIAALSEESQVIIRKSAHFTEYLFLGIALYHGFKVRVSGRWALWSLICVLLYAASDEFHQLFVAGRHGCVSDLLYDCAGGAAGVGLQVLINHMKKDQTESESWTGNTSDTN